MTDIFTASNGIEIEISPDGYLLGKGDYGSGPTYATAGPEGIAALWTPIFGHPVTPGQVALALTQLKIARLINTPTHEDSWVDAAGYIAIGAELATGDAE